MTPRTLGPFRDMARGTGGPLAAAVDQVAGRDAVVFGAVHQELAGRPTVMVVEDVHWADDATLDELGDHHHLLRRVLGALASQQATPSS